MHATLASSVRPRTNPPTLQESRQMATVRTSPQIPTGCARKASYDYVNLAATHPHINFVGVGGRAAFNVRSSVQIEAEMAYDFKRNFTTTFSNGVSTQLVSVSLRPLHALFGPKFSTGGGPFRLFGTFKAGLINFSVSNQNALSGFQSSLSDVTTGNTSAAIYPGAGLEGFFGPIGLRADIG